MTKNKIHPDEIDWLIVQACSCEVLEIKEEALQKLKDLGHSEEKIKEKYKQISSNEFPEEIFSKAYKIQEERNIQESYSTREKLMIFFFGPLMISPYSIYGLYDLFKFNYQTKFKQRLILLICGILFWVLLVIMGFKWSEYQWQKKVDNANIHEWENNRIK
jgi:hypothetical protein